MRKRRIFLLFLALYCGLVSSLAQSVTITEALQLRPMASAVTMYKNQFGKWEKPDLDITFPYSVIRMYLDGDAREVTLAKQRLTLYMGTMTAVLDVYKENSNEILFLVPARRPTVYIDCGDGCERVLLSDNQQLQPNGVYDCTVNYVVHEDFLITDTVYVNQGPQVYPLNLRVEPANAKVEISTNTTKQDWILNDGIASVQLLAGEYQYKITADNYYPAMGTIQVPTATPDTTIRLRCKFGWLSIVGDSMDLQGLSAEVTDIKQNKTILLPMEKMACYPGSYTIRVKKSKHHLYNETITIEEDKLTEVSPILLPKVYKRNTFLMAEGAYAMNPSWSAGLMIGQTYGEVNNKVGVGWYIKGRSNFQFQQNNSGLVANEGGKVNGNLMYYTGEKTASMWMANAGMLLNFLHAKAGKNAFGIYLGAGYGSYTRLWEMTDGTWVKYDPTSVKGVSFGAGLIGGIKGITLSVGVNSIQAKYMEVEAGLGWTF